MFEHTPQEKPDPLSKAVVFKLWYAYLLGVLKIFGWYTAGQQKNKTTL